MVADLRTAARRWPRFVPVAQESGFVSVQALPMRLRQQIIGALNLFRATPGRFDQEDMTLTPAQVVDGSQFAAARDDLNASDTSRANIWREITFFS